MAPIRICHVPDSPEIAGAVLLAHHRVRSHHYPTQQPRLQHSQKGRATPYSPLTTSWVGLEVRISVHDYHPDFHLQLLG